MAMTFSALMKRGYKGVKTSVVGGTMVPYQGAGGFIMDKTERYVGSYLFGRLSQKPELRTVWGIPTDAFVGGLLTLAGAAFAWHAGRNGGQSLLAPHLNAVGDAGMMGFAYAYGAGHEAQKASAPAKSPPAMEKVKGAHMLGAIDPAVGGAYLTDAELQRYRRPRA